MSKKLKDLKWESVALEGFPVAAIDKFQGFVGLEECTNYGLDKETKKSKKQKQKKKRKNENVFEELPKKKQKVDKAKTEKLKPVKEAVRLSNGFLVETINVATPSLTNEEDILKSKKLENNIGKKTTKQNTTKDKKEKLNKPSNDKNNIKKKTKLGDNQILTISELTPEDMLTWAEFKLQEPILKALMELGFKKPTKIQELTLPAAIHGRRDILGAAETGSGKTLAFGLPILSGIMKMKEKAELGIDVYDLPYKKTSAKMKLEQPTPVKKGIGCVKVIDDVEMPGHVEVKTGKPLYALILTPTRELAIQISRHLTAVAKYTGIKVATLVGGLAAVKQERVLRSGPEIVVATPGRLWELITQGQPHLQQLGSVKFLAIDETDRMIERGHFEELHPLLERLNADESRRGARQNFVFSATLTMVHDLPSHMRGKKVSKRGKIINRKIQKMTPQQKIKRLVTMIGMTDPKVVDITAQNLGTAETLTESRIACAIEHKDAYLYYIMKRHPGRTIVFCNSIGSVKRLAQLFTLLKCHPLPLHASMPQRQRLKNLERFRDDPYGMLVATDVAARGLDIPNVDHVIHYQVPKTAENYVHRSGRTARATKEGLTILMMEPSEAYSYAKMCHTLNKTTELPTFPVSPQCLSPLKELVSIARSLDTLMLKMRRATQASGWKEKAAREMDMIIDDDDCPVQQVNPSLDKELQVRKRQLDSMLSRPLFPKGFSFKYPTLNDPTVFTQPEENALQVMKKALESGELKKEKRKSKNSSLLKLQKS